MSQLIAFFLKKGMFQSDVDKPQTHHLSNTTAFTGQRMAQAWLRWSMGDLSLFQITIVCRYTLVNIRIVDTLNTYQWVN